jgi:hypothetical protein
MKIEADERRLRQAVERGEWKSADVGRRGRTGYARFGTVTSAWLEAPTLDGTSGRWGHPSSWHRLR